LDLILALTVYGHAKTSTTTNKTVMTQQEVS